MVKVIIILQVIVKDHLIPTMREYEDDPHGLWEHFKQRFESWAAQHKLVLTHKLANLHMMESMTVEQYIRLVDNVKKS